MSIKDAIVSLAQSAKVALIASAMTAGTGIGTVIDLIPSNIGKLASLAGFGLSVILIRLHVINIEKSKLDLEIKRNELKMIKARLHRDIIDMEVQKKLKTKK